jgi:hypothetical protein
MAAVIHVQSNTQQRARSPLCNKKTGKNLLGCGTEIGFFIALPQYTDAH